MNLILFTFVTTIERGVSFIIVIVRKGKERKIIIE